MNVVVMERDPSVRQGVTRLVRRAGYTVSDDSGTYDVPIVDPADAPVDCGDGRAVVLGVGLATRTPAHDERIDVHLTWPADADFLVRLLHRLAG